METPRGAEYGKAVDPAKVPSYEEALAYLIQVEKLLTKVGPGAVKRKARALDVLKNANDYEVWTRSLLSKEGKLFPISARAKDTFMDPATETYHSM